MKQTPKAFRLVPVLFKRVLFFQAFVPSFKIKKRNRRVKVMFCVIVQVVRIKKKLFQPTQFECSGLKGCSSRNMKMFRYPT